MYICYGTISKAPDDKVQNSESLVSMSGTPKEANDNVATDGIEQPDNQSGEQVGDILKTTEPTDPTTETQSPETKDIAINSPTSERIIYVSWFCLCWRCTRAGMSGYPNVVVLCQVFWV